MRKPALSLLILLSLMLSGCWDMTEIEDSIYVASIGVDSAGDGEYIWTFRLIEAEKLVLGMLTSVPGREAGLVSGTLSVRAASLEQAVHMIQPSMARIISLEHVRWVAFGEELARKGIGPLLSQFLRNHQIRRGTGLYVFIGDTVNGFRYNQPVADTNAIKFFETVRLVQKRFHLSPPLQMQHFYSRLMAPGLDPTLALVTVNFDAMKEPDGEIPPAGERSFKAGELPREGSNPVEFVGTAVFRGDRLAGMLNVDETQALLAMRGEMGKVYASVPDPREEGKVLTLRFHQENKPQFRVRFAGRRPVAHVKIQFEGEILSTPGKTDYTLAENRRILEQHINTFMEKSSFVPMLRRVYGEWGADPVGFGQLYRSRFATMDDWLAYRWPDHVKDMLITVEVDMFIRRFGLMLGNPDFE